MMRRKDRDGERVCMRDSKTLETTQSHSLGDIDRRGFGKRELPEGIA